MHRKHPSALLILLRMPLIKHNPIPRLNQRPGFSPHVTLHNDAIPRHLAAHRPHPRPPRLRKPRRHQLLMIHPSQKPMRKPARKRLLQIATLLLR